MERIEKFLHSLNFNPKKAKKTIRLLELPKKVQKFIENDKLSVSKAQLLFKIDDEEKQEEIAERVVDEKPYKEQTQKYNSKINFKRKATTKSP